MISTYYVPKRPISVPLYNTESQTYTLYFEDSEVDIPADLFFKLFQKVEDEHEEKAFFKKDEPKPSITEFIRSNYTHEEIDKETEEVRKKMFSQIRFAKSIGITREMFMSDIINSPQSKAMFHDKPSLDFMVSLTNSIWDEVEKN